MRQSMSRVGRCIDNGPMEGYWGILKSEMYYLRKFTTQEELTKAIEDYILFYNTKRYQLKLKCMTPMEYHTACRGVKNSTLLRSRVEFTQLNILLLFRLST